ncbi:MAG: nucleoside-diphosphate kinase [Bacteroidales bacterium]|nr:nucleoside-diphosphate kinase [Bacteroidales bacterium]
MAGNVTLTMIKPRAVETSRAGNIISIILDNGFRISAMKLIHLSRQRASEFYAEHEGKPFYEALIEFMSSGPIIVAIIEKENAVEEYRRLIGPTDPSKAPAGTIRNLYGQSVRENAVHGSDSDESAQRECSFFFSKIERF